MTTDAKALPSSIFKFPSLEQLERERKRLRRRDTFRKSVIGTLSALVTVAAIAVLTATLILPVMQISGESMSPTLSSGDVVLLLKTDSVKKGELCGFSWNNKTLIKRVIAVGGDTVEISAEGAVSVNGTVLNESYISALSLGTCDIEFPLTVPEGSFFVLGDNRAESADSRSSAVGCVDSEQMIGRVICRVWPLDSLGLIN